MQPDAEPRLEGPLDHPLAVQLHDAAAGKPSHQGLANFRRVGPRLGCERERLRRSDYVHRHRYLVGDFAGLPRPVIADEHDVLAHQLEIRLHAVEDFLLPADHDGQDGLLRPHLSAGDRRIQHVDPHLG
jgi:hypothetical protein